MNEELHENINLNIEKEFKTISINVNLTKMYFS